MLLGDVDVDILVERFPSLFLEELYQRAVREGCLAPMWGEDKYDKYDEDKYDDY
jgi:hypothetical protein